jgi:DNA-binding GntR family transcriptional regulator
MHYRAVRSHGDPPFVYIDSWLPMSVGEQITPERIERRPLVVLIEAVCGVRIAEVQQVLSATLATREVARILSVPARSPLLVVKRLYFSSEGVPVDLSINLICPTRFEYQERLVRSGHR